MTETLDTAPAQIPQGGFLVGEIGFLAERKHGHMASHSYEKWEGGYKNSVNCD